MTVVQGIPNDTVEQVWIDPSSRIPAELIEKREKSIMDADKAWYEFRDALSSETLGNQHYRPASPYNHDGTNSALTIFKDGFKNLVKSYNRLIMATKNARSVSTEYNNAIENAEIKIRKEREEASGDRYEVQK